MKKVFKMRESANLELITKINEFQIELSFRVLLQIIFALVVIYKYITSILYKYNAFYISFFLISLSAQMFNIFLTSVQMRILLKSESKQKLLLLIRICQNKKQE